MLFATRSHIQSTIALAAILVFTVLLSPQRAWAQFTTASLGGTVVDSSGAGVPEAAVSVLNVATGFAQDLRTNGSGAFLFSRLPVGTYTLRVEKQGFSAYVQDQIVLTVNQSATLSIGLQIGQISDEVTVTAAAELIPTRTATGGQLIGEQQIVELPLQGRRPERLVYLAAGTVDLGRNACRICGQGGFYPGEETTGVNGTGQGQVQFQLDATSHNDTYLNTSLPFPNPDAVQEFNLQSSNFTAEYGNAAGGIVNVVVKSGTNDIHGTLFHFIRDGALNARQFFAPTQDTLKRNQSGGSFGGPILKNKLFYFGTFQGTRLTSTPAGLVTFVPTEAQRRGDFSSIATQLIDPVTKLALPNNQIPADRLSPVAQYFLKAIPLPNGADGRLTFPGTVKHGIDNQLMSKVDYSAGKHQINGRYFFTDYDEPAAIPANNVLAVSNQAKAVRVQNVSINHTYTRSSTLLFNTTFGLNRQRGGSTSTAPFSMASAGVNMIGPESTDLKAPPELRVSVTGGFGIDTNHLGDFDRGDFTFRHVMTKIAGNHELRIGGEAVTISNHLINTFQMSSQVTFNGSLSGNGLADFMFGRLSTFLQGGGEFKQLRGTRWGTFVQDNWTTNPRLTLNLGLRWDPYLPAYDRQGRVICFQPGKQSTRYPNAPAGLLFGGSNADSGCPLAGADPVWTNLGPRVGFAYRLTKDGRTSLRGGVGVFYTPERSGATNGQVDTAPFGGAFTLNDVSWSDPYGSKGLVNPFPNNFGPRIPGPEFVFAPLGNISYFSTDKHIPQIVTVSLRLERQFGKDWAMGLAYVGNKGTYLPSSKPENPAVYIPGASTVANTQSRRLYPNLGTISRGESGDNSLYHSVQLNLEKRFSHGFSILTNYVWSRTYTTTYVQDPFSPVREQYLSGDDVPNNFKFSNIWEIPHAPVSGVADKILNGWQLNAIAIWQSGFPFSVSSGRDNSFTGGTDRADFVGSGGNGQLSNDRPHSEMIKQWFDTSRFTANAIGTFGNTPRNFLRGPRYFNTDFGLLKVIKVNQRLGLQFRAEAFNLFNNVNFQLPNNNVSSAQFGQITAVVDDSQRIIQLGLKVLF